MNSSNTLNNKLYRLNHKINQIDVQKSFHSFIILRNNHQDTVLCKNIKQNSKARGLNLLFSFKLKY